MRQAYRQPLGMALRRGLLPERLYTFTKGVVTGPLTSAPSSSKFCAFAALQPQSIPAPMFAPAVLKQRTVIDRNPVLVPAELMNAFQRARQIVAPFGDNEITLADHCLQMATQLLHAQWVPDLYRRDMVVTALFHDVYYHDNFEEHGRLAARQLQGRVHPHVLGLMEHHIHLANDDHHLERFSVSTCPMLEHWRRLDLSTCHQQPCLSIEEFHELGYFEVEPSCSLYQSLRTDSGWLSPNGTIVWAAPSMWIERTPLLLAQKLHLFRAAGLPPLEIRITDGGPELVELVRAGEVHIGEIGLFPFLAAVAGKSSACLPARLVGSTFIQQLDHYLVARAEGVASLEDLLGRRVGVLSKGSCDSYLLRAMLATVGLKSSDVTEVALGAHYGKAEVLTDGFVDALFLVEPALTRSEDMGLTTVLMKASSLYPHFQWGGLFASDVLRSRNPEVLIRMLNVYQTACRGMHQAVTQGAPSNVVEALAEIGQESFGVKPETFLRALSRDSAAWQLQWQSVDFRGVQTCIEIQRGMGVLEGTGPQVNGIFDIDLLSRVSSSPPPNM